MGVGSGPVDAVGYPQVRAASTGRTVRTGAIQPRRDDVVKRHAKLHKNDTLNCTGGCYDNWEYRPSCGEAGLRVGSRGE